MSLDEAIERLETLVAEIKRVSFTDDKTSLGSALALRQEARLISEGASAFNVVVFGDLDNLKSLNDVYGHEAGDVAINNVGQTIHQIVIDDLQAKAFRPSGDEFVILLKQDLVERFLSAASTFGNIVFSYNEKELKTTMSLGYARSDEKTSFDDLLKRAEAACQHAKTQGAGACVEWTEDRKLNRPVRKNGKCQKCSAKISCDVPEQNAPANLKFCPCCGESL
jgi:diguanylate cyclase (GGDEF)-like protein